jgi:hypothetical protein
MITSPGHRREERHDTDNKENEGIWDTKKEIP